MNEPILISLSRLPDGSFVVVDALERQYRASNAMELGRILDELAQSGELPPLRTEKRNDVVGMLAQAVRRYMPQHTEIVDDIEPIAHVVTTRAMAYQEKRRRMNGRGG